MCVHVGNPGREHKLNYERREAACSSPMGMLLEKWGSPWRNGDPQVEVWGPLCEKLIVTQMRVKLELRPPPPPPPPPPPGTITGIVNHYYCCNVQTVQFENLSVEMGTCYIDLIIEGPRSRVGQPTMKCGK